MSDQIRLGFECGCFALIWAGNPIAGEEPGVKAGLACCKTHEAPHQTIEKIVPLVLKEFEIT